MSYRNNCMLLNCKRPGVKGPTEPKRVEHSAGDDLGPKTTYGEYQPGGMVSTIADVLYVEKERLTYN